MDKNLKDEQEIDEVCSTAEPPLPRNYGIIFSSLRMVYFTTFVHRNYGIIGNREKIYLQKYNRRNKEVCSTTEKVIRKLARSLELMGVRLRKGDQLVYALTVLVYSTLW
jgi:hypothetical protein